MGDLSKYSDEDLINILSSDTESELKQRGYKHGWYKETNADYTGAIYVLVNPAFPNLVKLGYSDDVRKRLSDLNSNSGLPDPYHCFAIYKVKKRLMDKKLHELIDSLNPSLRHTNNREFYEMDGQKAYSILSAIAQINGDENKLIVNPFEDAYFENNSSDNENTSERESENFRARTTTQAPLRFGMIHIPVGSSLVFIKDDSVICKTVDTYNQVEYRGQVYSISALACKLLNVSSAQGGRYFKYNGEILTDIRRKLGV